MRYIDSLNLRDNIKCFILIEPGMGYLIPVLQERHNNSKIIVLHVEPVLPDDTLQLNIPTLYSTETIEIQKFLETHIGEIDIDNVYIIEWRPSMNFYKEAYVKLLSDVVEFIKRLKAENMTTAAFGKRWIKNFFRNIVNINQTLLYRQIDLPVIVTGSGPSLEQSVPVIRNSQDTHIIIAASSSLMALNAGGITADIIISTDGGNWALRHIYPFLRNIKSCNFAVNLCAALPSQCADFPKLLINDGSFWQSIVLNELALPSIVIPQRGTVTATAVELAMILSNSDIYIAGMDLSVNDIRTHTRPYSFDSLFFANANRFKPFYTEIFSRSSLIKKGGSMDIYAAWFKQQLPSWRKRVFSVGSHNFFSESIPQNTTVLKKNREFLKTTNVKKDPSQFRETGISAVISAMKNSKYTENLKQELTQLLFPGKKNISEQQIENMLLEVING